MGVLLDPEGDSCSEAEFGVSHLGGSAWLGSPLVTSCPPAHHGQAGLKSEHGAVLRFPEEHQRWCCACLLAPTSPHAVCNTLNCLGDGLGPAGQLSGLGSVLQLLLTLRQNQSLNK